MPTSLPGAFAPSRAKVVTRVSAKEDAILFWNSVALDTVAADIDRASDNKPDTAPEAAGPVLGARALAMVHLAMLEAYNAASGTGFPTYLGVGNGPTNLPSPPPVGGPGSFIFRLPAVAASGAAYTVLTTIFTNQRQRHNAGLEQCKVAFQANESGGLFDTYFAYGHAVAERVLLLRRDDPVNNIVESRPAGGFKPDLYNGGYDDATAYAPRYGFDAALFSSQKRYSLREPSEFAAQNSVLPDDVEYLNWKGIEPAQLNSIPADRRRTERETQTGVYWAYDGPKGLGTPPRLYNQIIRQVAIARGNSEYQNASLFALANIAMADAGTLAWQQKYKSFYYRPSTGMPANGLPNWKPLGAPRSNQIDAAANFTPNFPAYPSGHATFGAAALHILRLFYPKEQGGVDIGNRGPDRLLENLTFVSDELNGRTTDSAGFPRPRVPRKHPGGLWEMIIENGLSRAFLGVHWTFDAFKVVKSNNGLGRTPDFTSPGSDLIGGVPLGLTIAEDIWKNAGKARVEGEFIAVPKRSSAPAAVQAYTIQTGDTLFSIATRFQTNVQELLDLNPYTFPDPDLIFVGQRMLVPSVRAAAQSVSVPSEATAAIIS